MVRTAPGLPGKNKLVNWFANSSVCQLLFSLIKLPPVIHYFGYYFSHFFNQLLTCINIAMCKLGLGDSEENQYEGYNLHRT